MRLVALLLLALASAPAHAELLDRVVAVVGDQLVLASEVRLERDLARLDKNALPFWQTGRNQALERLVDAAVVRVAASDVGLYQPSDDEVRERREAVRAEFEDRRSWLDFLEAHGLDENSLAVVLRRRMVVERFLARNIQVPVEDTRAWNKASGELIDTLAERGAGVRLIDVEK